MIKYYWDSKNIGVYEHMLLMIVYYVAYDNLNIYYAYDLKIP
jgi:hypothetical protein